MTVEACAPSTLGRFDVGVGDKGRASVVDEGLLVGFPFSATGAGVAAGAESRDEESRQSEMKRGRE